MLLVEDNPGDIVLVQRAIRKLELGVEVDVVNDGEQAIEYLEEHAKPSSLKRPDLILLDLKMPRKDGLEVLSDISRDDALRRIPVVVLTSSMAPSDVDAAYRLGARGCFTKPGVKLRELLSHVVGFIQEALPVPDSEGLVTDAVAPSSSVPQDETAHDFLTAVVNSATDAIIGVALDGTIQSWNAAAERLYGYLSHEVVGRSIELIVPSLRQDEWDGLWENVCAGAPLQEFQTVRVNSEGRELYVRISVSPVLGARGQIVGASLIARDVTEERQAEDRFKMAVEASPSAMIMVNNLGQIVMMNAEGERLFGYTREELSGQTIERLVPAGYRQRHPALRGAFHNHPEARAMGAGRELHGLRKDGSEVPIEIGLTPIQTRDGDVVLCSIVDVSERRRAQLRFQLAVEASPSGIAMVNEHGQIVMVNAQTEQMFGYSRDELLGGTIERLIPQRFRGQHVHHRKDFVRAPEARAMGSGRDLYGLRKDGSELPVEIGLTPIEADEGRLILITIVDITARKEAESELAEQARELARSNQELEQFAYVASHDLQEPLRMVHSYTSLLAEICEEQLDADQEAKQYITFAQQGAERMRLLINDLLAYSRVRSRGKELVPVDTRACFQQAQQQLSLLIQESGVVIHQIDDAPTGIVLADHSQLLLLFQNLLSNAIKFCVGAPIVEVRSWSDGDAWTCAIKDNGIGIAPEHKQKIFQMFSRLHSQEEFAGTGIGLALCQRIIQRHQGEIWFESDGRNGTTFFFTLQRFRGDV